jgi:hypothetical protein
MKRLLLFLPLLVVVILGIVLFAGIGKDPTALESALIGKPGTGILAAGAGESGQHPGPVSIPG